jgi:hypothetical protein
MLIWCALSSEFVCLMFAQFEGSVHVKDLQYRNLRQQ